MKKITLLALLLFAGYAGHAQYSFEGVNDHGRLNCMTYDLQTENKVYAISHKNHIVVSYDNGETWDVEYSFPDTRATLANLKLLPGNENLFFTVIYAGELDGMYVLNIEANEVINYMPLPALNENPSLQDIDVYDAEATTVIVNLYVDTGYKVFYTSTGGESWNMVYDMVENADIAPDVVAISPDNPTKLLIGRGPDPASDGGGGLFISEDAGETWALKLPGEHITAIAFDPEDSNDMMVSSGYFSLMVERVHRSFDGGETFTEIPMVWTDMVTDNVVAIKYHPVVPGTIFILEENEIIFTENDGDTWTHTAYPEEEYYSGFSISLNPFYDKEAIISTDNFPRRTTTGGTTLTQVKAPYFWADGVHVVKYDGVDNLYYSAQGGHHHKDYATGMTGAYNVLPSSYNQLLRNHAIPDPANEGRVVIYDYDFFQGGKMFISFDHGATRTQIATSWTPVFTTMATDPQDNNIVYAVLYNYENSEVYKFNIADPANITYEMVTTPSVGGNIETYGRIGSIMFPTGESDTMVITYNNALYKTINGGDSWTEMSEIENAAMIWDISVNPFNVNNIAVATDIGTYTSTDSGVTWTLATDDISTSVKYSDVENGIMAIGVQGVIPGSYIKYYNGTDWVTVTAEELNYLETTMMDFSFEGNNINAYVGTIDVGVVKYTFEIGELGIKNPQADAAKIIITPNPASGMVQISATGGFTIDNVFLYSITGQKVFQSNSSTIDVSSLSSGIYIIKTETSEGKLISKKLVKK